MGNYIKINVLAVADSQLEPFPFVKYALINNNLIARACYAKKCLESVEMPIFLVSSYFILMLLKLLYLKPRLIK